MSLPLNPLIYEINTWAWLNELSRKFNRSVTLSSIPASEYDKLQKSGFDAVWLMGVWERSPAGISIARQHPVIMKDMTDALPDFTESDLAGSPYCIRRYRVESQLGGAEGLAIARQELSRRGMKLILDFVPNHVAPDHPWTLDHPEYFLRGTEADIATYPDDYLESNNQIYARARDPFFPPWPDVLQLDIFNEGLRKALTETIREIASQCDGIRCDMAMLVLNDIFARTWGEKAGKKPGKELWDLLIPAARKVHPEFIFIAEVYWDMEWEMMQRGFDYCYDKRLYDRLLAGSAEGVHQHLTADLNFQSKLLRFIENHDEARAASFQPENRHFALALASLTLPGARLLHQGQFEGRKTRVPVFLGRRPHEPVQPDVERFYMKLLDFLKVDTIRNGGWSTCQVTGWVDNLSYRNLLAWEWADEKERLLVVINLSDQQAQGHVFSDFGYPPGKTLQMFDFITGELYTRDSDEMNHAGLFAGLRPWGAHAFSFEI